MFVDIHSHIIPYIDDGARDMAEAEKMLRIAADKGTVHIVATPHYIDNGFENDAIKIKSCCNEISKFVEEKDIGIHVHTGSELFMSPQLPELLARKVLNTINESSFILVEFPILGIPQYSDSILFAIQTQGLVPIIAHPERYSDIIRNVETLEAMVQRGMLVQINSGSLEGLYGSSVKKTAMKLIRSGMAHFIASDSHSSGTRSPDLSKAAEIVQKKFGSDIVERLFFRNGLAVIENRDRSAIIPSDKVGRRSFFQMLQHKR